MPEESKTQDVSQETTTDQANQQDQPTLTAEELVSKAVEEVKEKFKTELSGLNRRNSELEKELKKKELEKLSEKERIQAELADARAEKEKIEREAKDIIRARNVDKHLYDAGLSPDLARRIIGDDEESIKADVKKLKDYITAEIAKGVEEARTKNVGSGSHAFSGQGKSITLKDFNQMSPKARSEYMAGGGTLTE